MRNADFKLTLHARMGLWQPEKPSWLQFATQVEAVAKLPNLTPIGLEEAVGVVEEIATGIWGVDLKPPTPYAELCAGVVR